MVLDITLGRFLTTGSFLPLAEISAVGLLVASLPLDGGSISQPQLKYFL
jgi:hypothetical protein